MKGKIIMAKENYEQLCLTISPELNDWLSKISLDMKRGGSYKAPKTVLIRAMLRAILESGVRPDLSKMKVAIKKGEMSFHVVASKEFEDAITQRFVKAIKGK